MPNEFKHSLYRMETQHQRGFRDTATPVGEPKVTNPSTGGPSRGLVLDREHMLDAGEEDEGEEQGGGEEVESAGVDEE